MNQPSQEFAYGQLHSLSFIQLFHLCVAIAGWQWTQSRDRALILGRVQECDRRRLLQPAYGAVFLRDSRDVRCEPSSDRGDCITSCDEAW
jgi:hypothetical protein